MLVMNSSGLVLSAFVTVASVQTSVQNRDGARMLLAGLAPLLPHRT